MEKKIDHYSQHWDVGKKITDLVKGWEFQLDEVSNNVYEVTGMNATGKTVFAKGFFLDQLLDSCVKRAKQIDERQEKLVNFINKFRNIFPGKLKK